VLHFVHDDEQAAQAVRTLLGARPEGNYLALSHGTMDFSTAEGIDAYEKMFAAGRTDVRARSRPAFREFFDGTGLVEPGIVAVSDWRAEDQPAQRPVTSDLGIYAAVGKKL